VMWWSPIMARFTASGVYVGALGFGVLSSPWTCGWTHGATCG
jgi:hypothetical protein